MQINLIDNEDFTDSQCPHCEFYFYLRHILRIAYIASFMVDENENIYFKNIHERIYSPFIKRYEEQLSARRGAIIVASYLKKKIKSVLHEYAKEDILFMIVALREISTWKIFSKNPWESSHVRTVCHVLTNLVNTFDDELFGDLMIIEETDFISLFVYIEEFEKLISNVFNSKHFCWNPSLEEIIKTRIENEKLAWFHAYFEVKELQKPEEITFNDDNIVKYVEQRGYDIETIKKDVGQEVEKLFGFSFKDINIFRKEFIFISEENGQILDISPAVNNDTMKVMFIFEEQLQQMSLNQGKIKKIINTLTYKPTFNKDMTLDELANPHLDYKFILTYDNILAFGLFDSSNSITMFENLSTTDHFIEEIFGKKASKKFKQAQSKISTLMGIKIATHFANKPGFFVPMQQKNVPHINLKIIKGNGVRKRIVDVNNQDLGDIDAVTVDENNKTILLIEIKYYKPTTNLREIHLKDKKIYEDIDKILARAKWFEENLSDVITAWDLKHDNYKIETLLVTGRPNFYGKQIESEYKGQIKYYTYDGILRS